MNYTLITTTSKLREVLPELLVSPILYADTETTHLDPYRARLLMIQIYTGTNAYVIDCTHSVDLTLLNPVWLSDTSLKVFHNASYDLKIIYNLSKILITNVYDTMVTERMLTAGFIGVSASLQAVAKRRLNVTLDKAVRSTFTESEVTELSQEQIEYAVKDVLVLPDIREQQLTEIAELDLFKVHRLEMDLCPVVAFIEYTGMPFEAKHLLDLDAQFLHIIEEAQRVVQDMFIQAGVCNQIIFSRDGYSAFNPSSNQQMVEMFNKVGIDLPSLNARLVMQWDFKNRRSAKNFNVDFAELSDDTDISDAMAKFGSFENKYIQAYSFHTAVKKIYSTYVKSLPTMENPITKRIHCSFNQYGAATGRFSSSQPNLQNIPSDQKMKNIGVNASIRHAFKVSAGRKLIIADYSTIELVIIADASGDTGLITNLEDLHTFVAREVLGVKDINNKNKKEHPYKLWRDVAKMVNYSIAYNVGGDSLGKQMTIALSPLGEKIGSERAERIIEDWKQRFPQAASWLKESARSVVLYGKVKDSYGRMRFWDRSDFQNKWRRASAEREAMNFPIQALSASMVKLALINTFRKLNPKKARIVSTVHDEIIVESSEQYAEVAAQILKEEMEWAAKQVLPKLGDTVEVSPAISDKYDK
jgi:DNA polymerase-1